MRYQVRRVPTPYELHKAQERAYVRRIIRDGVITALLCLGTVAAILAAGAVPVRSAEPDQPCISAGWSPGDIFGPGPLDVIPDLPQCPDQPEPDPSAGPDYVAPPTDGVPKPVRLTMPANVAVTPAPVWWRVR